MEGLVAAFNRLDRPKRILLGIARNHWYFKIRHVPFHPAGDRVQITNIDSRWYVITERKKIISLPTLAARVDVIVRLILEIFVEGVHNHRAGQSNASLPSYATPAYAPFSWGTSSPELSSAIETKLRSLGVREDLCTVLAGTKEQDEIADETWGIFMTSMVKMGMQLPLRAAPGRVICCGCKKDSSWISTAFIQCPKCNADSYCSRVCQIAGSTEHNCMAKAQPLDPSDYYHKLAHQDQDARTLAESISLPLPPTDNGLL